MGPREGVIRDLTSFFSARCGIASSLWHSHSRLWRTLESPARPRRYEKVLTTYFQTSLSRSSYSAERAQIRLTRSLCDETRSSFTADHLRRETLHLFKLRTELQQQQIDSGMFEFGDALAYLFRSADESGTQPAI
jgi:hypothetical protein